MLFGSRDTFISSFPIFIFLPYHSGSTMLKKSSESWYLALFLILGEKPFSLSPLNKMLVLGFYLFIYFL